MRTINLNRKKKGVSPIIATLLLIVIAVAAAVVTYAFVTGFIGTSTASAKGGQGAMATDVAFIAANGSICATIRDTGATVLTLAGAPAAVYVNNVAMPTSVLTWQSNTLSPGATDNLVIANGTASGQWPSGTAVQVKVVATDGTPLSFNAH